MALSIKKDWPLFALLGGLVAVAFWQRETVVQTSGDIVQGAGQIVSRVVSTLTRGFRNNNPLNIRVGQDWQGETVGNTDGAFEQFTSPEYGYRAGCRILDNYRTRYGFNSVSQIVRRWAPPSDNNPTDAYAAYVAGRLGVGVDVYLGTENENTMAALMDALTRFENSRLQPYGNEVILQGIRLARGELQLWA